MTVTPSSRPFGDPPPGAGPCVSPAPPGSGARRPAHLLCRRGGPRSFCRAPLRSSEPGRRLPILSVFRACSGGCARPGGGAAAWPPSLFFPPQALGLNIYMTCLLLELVSVVPKDFCGQSKMRVFLGCRDGALGPLLGWKVVGVNLSSWSQGVIRGHRDPFLISSLPPL